MPLNLIPTTIALLLVFYWFSKISVKRGAREFRTILYLYFQTACTFFLALWWARSSGAIDSAGMATNEAGEWISWIMNLCSHLNEEFNVAFGIIIFVFLPQILTYIVAGIPHGHAQRSLMFTFIIYPVTYLLGKAIISFCGLALAAIPFAHVYKLTNNQEILYLPSMIIYVAGSISFMALPMGFLAVWLYRYDLPNLCPKVFQDAILHLHEWMTRNEPRPQKLPD